MSEERDRIEEKPHIPVLVDAVLHYLDPQPYKVYLDVTFGAGGHTRAILNKEPLCRVIVMDWDKQSLETYFPPLHEEFGDRVSFIWGNFAHVYRLLKKENIKSVDGVLADFGTSYMHIFDRPGFSFKRPSFLDMRMSPAHYRITAADVIREADEKTLVWIFQELGQEPHARRIARKIVEVREKQTIDTTTTLAQLIEKAVPGRGRLHPATKVFQALRIYVNRELDNIKAFLASLEDILAPGGRCVCISFHSLEDGLVKHDLREKEQKGTIKVLTKKVIIALQEEVKRNPSSRSAKLRAAKVL